MLTYSKGFSRIYNLYTVVRRVIVLWLICQTVSPKVWPQSWMVSAPLAPHSVLGYKWYIECALSMERSDSKGLAFICWLPRLRRMKSLTLAGWTIGYSGVGGWQTAASCWLNIQLRLVGRLACLIACWLDFWRASSLYDRRFDTIKKTVAFTNKNMAAICILRHKFNKHILLL